MQYTTRTLNNIIIVDIDETIAQLNGRDYYAWHLVKHDTVKPHIKAIIDAFKDTHCIVFITGRSEVCRDDTIQWFKDNHIHYDSLYMKPKNCVTKSEVFKQEILEAYTAERPDTSVTFALDDRQKVIDMWTNNNVPAILV
jgi:uncharacterized HAD superfamily protein